MSFFWYVKLFLFDHIHGLYSCNCTAGTMKVLEPTHGVFAAKANVIVTNAYSKDGNVNQPLVMIAHDLEGGLY